MNHKTIFAISFFLISIVSGAQQNYGIKKVDAFFKEHLPGNIPVDADGNSLYHGPDTIYTIYIETKGNSPDWTTAWKNSRSFSISTTIIKETPFEVGISKLTNKKIILKPAPGNKLWLLELEKNSISSKPPVKTKRGEIILQEKSGKKIVIRRISRLTELAVLPSV
jgi:hypothetical protein